MKPTIRSTIADEWTAILKDKRLMALLFLVPILYTTLFGAIYSHHKVTELRTVVVDEDRSPTSRQIVQAFEESESFHITEEAYSEEDARRQIADGSARVALVIPTQFEMSLKQGKTLPLLTLVDGSNMIIANTATKGANEIITTFSMGTSMKKLQLQQGLQDEQVTNVLSPIPYRYRIMYNPTYNYNEFMLFGLVGAILQQVLFLGIALTITREKEFGTWARFRAWKRDPWFLAFAKTFPYFLINLTNTVVSFLVTTYVFQIPMRGSILPVMVLVAAFTVAVSGYGYLISMFMGNQLGATQISMLIAVPSFMLSGYTWPMESMPKVLQEFSYALPLTRYLDGIRNVLVKGNDMNVIWRDCIALGLMGAVTFTAAMLWTRFMAFRKFKDDAEEELPVPAILPASKSSTSLPM